MVNFKHEKSGLIKKVPTGFSWTTLFFGFFVPMFRGAWLLTIISILAAIFTAGLAWLIFPFIINKLYIKHLLETGYQPRSNSDIDILNQIGITIDTSAIKYTEASDNKVVQRISPSIDNTKLRRTILGGLLGLPIGFVIYLSMMDTKLMMLYRVYLTHDERPTVSAIVIFLIFSVAVCSLIGRELAGIGLTRSNSSNKDKGM